MATVANSPLSQANQEKAQRKIAINGSAAMVSYALSTVLTSLAATGQTVELTAVPTMSNLGLWMSAVFFYSAVIATVAAFVWPMYLSVLENR